jgi:hypothetical protein
MFVLVLVFWVHRLLRGWLGGIASKACNTSVSLAHRNSENQPKCTPQPVLQGDEFVFGHSGRRQVLLSVTLEPRFEFGAHGSVPARRVLACVAETYL